MMGARIAQLRQEFGLDNSEELFGQFSCAHTRPRWGSRFLQGHLFVFSSCMVFQANLLGVIKVEHIDFKDVHVIRKRSFMRLPNTIAVVRFDGAAGLRDDVFTSFFFASRKKAYGVMVERWRQANPEVAEAYLSSVGHSGCDEGRHYLHDGDEAAASARPDGWQMGCTSPNRRTGSWGSKGSIDCSPASIPPFPQWVEVEQEAVPAAGPDAVVAASAAIPACSAKQFAEVLLSDLSGFLPAAYKAQENELKSLSRWQGSNCDERRGPAGDSACLRRTLKYIYSSSGAWGQITSVVVQEQVLWAAEGGALVLEVTQTMPDLPAGVGKCFNVYMRWDVKPQAEAAAESATAVSPRAATAAAIVVDSPASPHTPTAAQQLGGYARPPMGTEVPAAVGLAGSTAAEPQDQQQLQLQQQPHQPLASLPISGQLGLHAGGREASYHSNNRRNSADAAAVAIAEVIGQRGPDGAYGTVDSMQQAPDGTSSSSTSSSAPSWLSVRVRSRSADGRDSQTKSPRTPESPKFKQLLQQQQQQAVGSVSPGRHTPIPSLDELVDKLPSQINEFCEKLPSQLKAGLKHGYKATKQGFKDLRRASTSQRDKEPVRQSVDPHRHAKQGSGGNAAAAAAAAEGLPGFAVAAPVIASRASAPTSFGQRLQTDTAAPPVVVSAVTAPADGSFVARLLDPDVEGTAASAANLYNSWLAGSSQHDGQVASDASMPSISSMLGSSRSSSVESRSRTCDRGSSAGSNDAWQTAPGPLMEGLRMQETRKQAAQQELLHDGVAASCAAPVAASVTGLGSATATPAAKAGNTGMLDQGEQQSATQADQQPGSISSQSAAATAGMPVALTGSSSVGSEDNASAANDEPGAVAAAVAGSDNSTSLEQLPTNEVALSAASGQLSQQHNGEDEVPGALSTIVDKAKLAGASAAVASAGVRSAGTTELESARSSSSGSQFSSASSAGPMRSWGALALEQQQQQQQDMLDAPMATSVVTAAPAGETPVGANAASPLATISECSEPAALAAAAVPGTASQADAATAPTSSSTVPAAASMAQAQFAEGSAASSPDTYPPAAAATSKASAAAAPAGVAWEVRVAVRFVKWHMMQSKIEKNTLASTQESLKGIVDLGKAWLQDEQQRQPLASVMPNAAAVTAAAGAGGGVPSGRFLGRTVLHRAVALGPHHRRSGSAGSSRSLMKDYSLTPAGSIGSHHITRNSNSTSHSGQYGSNSDSVWQVLHWFASLKLPGSRYVVGSCGVLMEMVSGAWQGLSGSNTSSLFAAGMLLMIGLQALLLWYVVKLQGRALQLLEQGCDKAAV